MIWFVLLLGFCTGILLGAFVVSIQVSEKTSSHQPVFPGGLPLKNPDLDNTQQGLYNKFQVHRRDGSDMPGGKHENCEYFVLDLTHDPYGLETAAYYAKACKETHPLLSKDLADRVNAAFQHMEDEGKL